MSVGEKADKAWPSGHAGVGEKADKAWPSGHAGVGEKADKAWPSGHAGVLAIDTWGFHEMIEGGPHAEEVRTVIDDATFAFTTREVVAETFNIIVRRTGGTRMLGRPGGTT